MARTHLNKRGVPFTEIQVGDDASREELKKVSGGEDVPTLVVGRSVAEAWMLMHMLERAARAQLRAMAATGGQVLVASPELASLTYRQWVGDGSEWDGDLEWPALLRRLDRSAPGYRD